MSVIFNHVTSVKPFRKQRRALDPPLNLKRLFACVDPLPPFKRKKKQQLTPRILETGEEISERHPFLRAWEPLACLVYGLNIVWIPKGKKFKPPNATWDLETKAPNADVVLRCHLLDLFRTDGKRRTAGIRVATARELAKTIVGYLDPHDYKAMPISTEGAKKLYLAETRPDDSTSNCGRRGYSEQRTRQLYDALHAEVTARKGKVRPPKGLLGCELPKCHVASLFFAHQEARQLFKEINASGIQCKGNPHFHINTRHRGRDDQFPLIALNDKRVQNLVNLVKLAAQELKMPVEPDNISRLNVIVREYREGDKIGWHTDWAGYGESVGGIILENKMPDRSLLFHRIGHPPIAIPEKKGFMWKISDDIRWKYTHGLSYSPPQNGGRPKSIRASISFRFFNNEIEAKKNAGPTGVASASDAVLSKIERPKAPATVKNANHAKAVPGKSADFISGIMSGEAMENPRRPEPQPVARKQRPHQADPRDWAQPARKSFGFDDLLQAYANGKTNRPPSGRNGYYDTPTNRDHFPHSTPYENGYHHSREPHYNEPPHYASEPRRHYASEPRRHHHAKQNYHRPDNRIRDQHRHTNGFRDHHHQQQNGGFREHHQQNGGFREDPSKWFGNTSGRRRGGGGGGGFPGGQTLSLEDLYDDPQEDPPVETGYDRHEQNLPYWEVARNRERALGGERTYQEFRDHEQRHQPAHYANFERY